MKRLFTLWAVVFFIVVVPFVSTTASSYAGHSASGFSCTCGCAGCICDPGEEPNCPDGNLVARQGQNRPVEKSITKATVPQNEFDPVGIGLLIFFMTLLIVRHRA